ncbi:cytochrome-c peroxidase [Sphingobacterium mizutaii]|uniref:cytochrome-c peroxidase n=1 Tax=Sphingobacterium mizutaii TaxID=1010 RepID=UPI00289B54D1|nr:cytochrome c peroxidase [Sphingobacterium mizutaii]
MRKIKWLVVLFFVLGFLSSCQDREEIEEIPFDNPELPLEIPMDFPAMNSSVQGNKPTKYGVELGKMLFNEKRFSGNNTISCASCHRPEKAFSDENPKSIGVYNRVGLRNTPPVQNMAFMRHYNWDGNILQLEKQPLVPIITHEEMNSSIMEVIGKLRDDPTYKEMFRKAFGDEQITADRIYKSIVQFEYTLISANSKYDRVMHAAKERFTDSEERGLRLFEAKCKSCHSTGLFTDQTFRNIGFPVNPDTEEAGRARVTGDPKDWMSYRVPSLRNIEFTAPYGSFGQFKTLKDVLDYMDQGVLYAENLDPIFKANGNRLPMNEEEKADIIAFLKTLSDHSFVAQK